MSRIIVPPADTATGPTAELYARIRKNTGGRLPNSYVDMGHLAPRLVNAFLDAEGALNGAGLPRKDIETIRLLVSANSGCDYCVAAHSMIGKAAGLSDDELRALRHMETTGEPRRDALVRFVLDILRKPGTLPAESVDAIRAAGYSDAQLVAISFTIALMTFTNTFNRINDTDIDFPPVE
jgi:uncharacterized peroxidase-related enzyme